MPIVTIATAPAVAIGKVSADTKITVTTKAANTTSMLIGFIYFTSFKFGYSYHRALSILPLTWCPFGDFGEWSCFAHYRNNNKSLYSA